MLQIILIFSILQTVLSIVSALFVMKEVRINRIKKTYQRNKSTIIFVSIFFFLLSIINIIFIHSLYNDFKSLTGPFSNMLIFLSFIFSYLNLVTSYLLILSSHKTISTFYSPLGVSILSLSILLNMYTLLTMAYLDAKAAPGTNGDIGLIPSDNFFRIFLLTICSNLLFLGFVMSIKRKLVFPYNKSKGAHISEAKKNEIKNSIHIKNSMINQTFFFWIDKLLYKLGKHSIRMTNVNPLNNEEQISVCEEQIRKHWLPTVMKKGASKLYLFYKLMTIYKSTFIISIITKLLHDISEFSQAMALYEFLKFIKLKETMKNRILAGVCIMLIYTLLGFFLEMSLMIYYKLNILTGVRIKQGLSKIIYTESVNSNIKDAGKASNVVSSDLEAISECFSWFHGAWSYLLQIIVYSYALYQEIKFVFLVSIGIVLFIVIPSTYIAQKYVYKYKNKVLKVADRRIKLITEFIMNLKILKLYGWNNKFTEKIKAARNDELPFYNNHNFYNIIGKLMWVFTPIILKLSVFLLYIFTEKMPFSEIFKKEDNGTKAAIILLYVDSIRFPLNMYAFIISATISAILGTKRVSDFLKKLITEAEENKKTKHNSVKDEKEVLLEMNDVEFKFNGTTKFTVKDLKLPKGKLISVIGETSSGKSLLLTSIINKNPELGYKKFIKNYDVIGYAPQEPWALNGTIRENIVFGDEFNKERYLKTITNLTFNKDLKMISKSDLSVLGVSGLALSGGQMQRLNMARALYIESDLVVFDDCLSGLDNKVSEKVLNKAILGRDKGTSIILSTNSLKIAKASDICLLICNNQIELIGTPEEVLKHEKSKFLYQKEATTRPREHTAYSEIEKSKKDCNEEVHTVTRYNTLDQMPEPTDIDVLEPDSKIEESLSITGSDLAITDELQLNTKDFISFADRYFWANNAGGLHMVFLYLLTGLFNNNIARSLDISITNPLTQGIFDKFPFLFATLTFATMIFFYEVTTLTVFYYMMEIGFKRFHTKLINAISNCKISELDKPSTSTGSFINRFTSDLNPIDYRLSIPIRVSTIIFVGIVVPIYRLNTLYNIFFVSTIGYFLLIVFMFKFFIKQMVKLKTLYSKSMSSVYGNLENSIKGKDIIKAANKMNYVESKQNNYLDISSRVNYVFICFIRWMGVRFSMVTPIFMGSAMIYFLYLPHDQLEKVSVSLFFLYSVNSSSKYFVQYYCDVEKNFVSVKRIKETCSLEQEDIIPENETEYGEKISEMGKQGKIELLNVSAKYKGESTNVLDKLNCVMCPGEKVAIVGRTGAGKSTLLSVLLRVNELSEGKILLDGFDISKVSVDSVRRRMSIIPQNPTMFNDTLEYNIDPTSLYSAEDIKKAIELTNLNKIFETKKIENIKEFVVEGYGENLSLGEKQLVCLARALVRRTKIVLLDEATAALDAKMDELIQATIRKSFKHATIITVAHRISTIIDYDKVMVMDKGRIIEYGSPVKLLQNKSSTFSELYKLQSD